MLPSTDLVIAGAGPAGLSAAITAASEGLHVTLIDPNPPGGQSRWSTAIENVSGFPHGITGRQYADRAYRQAKRFGARLVDDRCETFCRLADHTIAIQLRSARMIECRAMVIATGQTPKPLTVPGSHRFGVFNGANPDDLPRYRDRTIAIIGGGNSAGQAAVAFSRASARVTLYARHVLQDTMSTYLIARLIDSIRIRLEPVDAIDRASDNRLLIGSDPYDAIFAFIGARPDHTLPVQCDDDGYILTNHFHTNVSGIYAIGDVRAASTKRIATAVGEGSAVVAIIHSDLKGSTV